jgi:drug/metabolite transporter (DMT)-like permease
VRCGWPLPDQRRLHRVPGIILGGLGYYFGLQGGNRAGQILGIAAVVLSVVSIVISGVSGGPQ